MTTEDLKRTFDQVDQTSVLPTTPTDKQLSEENVAPLDASTIGTKRMKTCEESESPDADTDDVDAEPRSYKIKLWNVQKYVDKKQLEKYFTTTIPLSPLPKIKKPPKMKFATLVFASESDHRRALTLLQSSNLELRNKVMRAEDSLPDSRDGSNHLQKLLNQRQTQNQTQTQTQSLAQAGDSPHQQTGSQPTQIPSPTTYQAPPVADARSDSERLNDQVTPLWKQPYPAQLEVKHASFRKVLLKFSRQLRDVMIKTERTKKQDRIRLEKQRAVAAAVAAASVPTVTENAAILEITVETVPAEIPMEMSVDETMVDAMDHDLENPAPVETAQVEPTASFAPSRIVEETLVVPEAEVPKDFLHSIKPNEPICLLHEIVPSPQTTQYRNKVEFTIGTSPSGSKTVGFLLGLFKDGLVSVSSPKACLHVSQPALDVAQCLEEFICDETLGGKWPVYDRVTNKGVWRLFLVRTNEKNQLIGVVQMNDKNLSPEEKTEMEESLTKYFLEKRDAGVITCDGLMYQYHSGVHSGFIHTEAFPVLFGSDCLTSHLLGLSFRVSPSSFFQVNHSATEGLYTTVGEWAGLNPQTPESNQEVVVLDLCCGTGTIGQILSKAGPKLVIGVDCVESSIQDAIKNAQENNIQNIHYICAKVEDAMKQILQLASATDSPATAPTDITSPLDSKLPSRPKVVAILDPPRSGVHPSVIRVLRESRFIDHLVYVSCDADKAMPNFIEYVETLFALHTSTQPGNCPNALINPSY